MATEPSHVIQLKLGPEPASSLEAMIGYGLDEVDIARYYGVTPSTIRRLVEHYAIDSSM